MYRSNRGYPSPGGFMGHETLEESNQQMEGELKEINQKSTILVLSSEINPFAKYIFSLKI